jgi:hypothetical protein
MPRVSKRHYLLRPLFAIFEKLKRREEGAGGTRKLTFPQTLLKSSHPPELRRQGFVRLL